VVRAGQVGRPVALWSGAGPMAGLVDRLRVPARVDGGLVPGGPGWVPRRALGLNPTVFANPWAVAIGAVAIGPVAAIGCAMAGLSASGLTAGRLKLRVIDAGAAAGSIVAVTAGLTLTVISLTGAARSPVRASSASTDIAN